jgi:hypothetical protein
MKQKPACLPASQSVFIEVQLWDRIWVRPQHLARSPSHCQSVGVGVSAWVSGVSGLCKTKISVSKRYHYGAIEITNLCCHCRSAHVGARAGPRHRHPQASSFYARVSSHRTQAHLLASCTAPQCASPHFLVPRNRPLWVNNQLIHYKEINNTSIK